MNPRDVLNDAVKIIHFAAAQPSRTRLCSTVCGKLGSAPPAAHASATVVSGKAPVRARGAKAATATRNAIFT